MIETASQALEILETIPEDKWITEDFSNSEEDPQCCAWGHLNNVLLKNPYDDKLTLPFIMKVRGYIQIKYNSGHGFTQVNDQKCLDFNEDHPKNRIIHLLKDMIKDGY